MISMAFGVLSFVWFWFSVITWLTKAQPAGATWLFPCLSPSSLPFLTIPEWFLCPICKESSWRGISLPWETPGSCVCEGMQAHLGHTLMRELPALLVGVPRWPCLLAFQEQPAAQKRLAEDMGHHFLFLLNHLSLSFYP